MTVVPGQEIINAVHGREGDMKGIAYGFSGECFRIDQCFRQCDNFISYREQGNPGQGLKPSCNR
jgi:hypothetical protein